MEAEPVLRESVDLFRGQGKGDLEITVALSGLGVVLLEQERYAEALPVLEEDRELFREVLGQDNATYAGCIFNLAMCLDELGRCSDAFALFEEALATARRWLGDLDRVSLNCERHLLRCLIHSGHAADASELAVELLERHRALPAPDERHIASLLRWRARALLAGEPGCPEAERLLRELHGNRGAEQTTDWRTHETATLLGTCLLAQGRLQEAEPLLRASAEAEVEVEGRYARESRLEAFEAMARWCDATGRAEEAASWRERRAALDAELKR